LGNEKYLFIVSIHRIVDYGIVVGYPDHKKAEPTVLECIYLFWIGAWNGDAFD
jgi:hypothetical protein